MADEKDNLDKNEGEAAPLIVSYEQIDAMEKADVQAKEIQKFAFMANNIAQAQTIPIEEKPKAFNKLFSQLQSRLKSSLKSLGTVFNPDVLEDTEIDGLNLETVQDKVKESILADIKETPTETEKNQPGFHTFKNKDGSMGWEAIYSNNFRDDDGVPEIIARESHLRFDAMLKSGEAAYPELWLHHIKGAALGVATKHSYDERGFSIASGYIYPERVWLAEHLKNLDMRFGVSHGMPKSSIERSTEDKTVIVKHITTEISILKLDKAANKFTNINLI